MVSKSLIVLGIVVLAVLVHATPSELPRLRGVREPKREGVYTRFSVRQNLKSIRSPMSGFLSACLPASLPILKPVCKQGHTGRMRTSLMSDYEWCRTGISEKMVIFFFLRKRKI